MQFARPPSSPHFEKKEGRKRRHKNTNTYVYFEVCMRNRCGGPRHPRTSARPPSWKTGTEAPFRTCHIKAKNVCTPACLCRRRERWRLACMTEGGGRAPCSILVCLYRVGGSSASLPPPPPPPPSFPLFSLHQTVELVFWMCSLVAAVKGWPV